MENSNKELLRTSVREEIERMLPKFKQYGSEMTEEEFDIIKSSITDYIVDNSFRLSEIGCGINDILNLAMQANARFKKKVCDVTKSKPEVEEVDSQSAEDNNLKFAKLMDYDLFANYIISKLGIDIKPAKNSNKELLRRSAREGIELMLPKFMQYGSEMTEEEFDKIMTSVTNYIVDNSFKLYEIGCGINDVLILAMQANTRFMKKVCDLIKSRHEDYVENIYKSWVDNGKVGSQPDEDTNLTFITLMDYDLSANYIINKLGIDMTPDNLILETIDKFDGSMPFRLYMSGIAKEYKNTKKRTL